MRTDAFYAVASMMFVQQIHFCQSLNKYNPIVNDLTEATFQTRNPTRGIDVSSFATTRAEKWDLIVTELDTKHTPRFLNTLTPVCTTDGTK